MEPSAYPPGWYLDPVPGAPLGRYRYWTGKTWTEHLAGEAETAPGIAKRRHRWVRPTVTAIALAALVGVGGYFISGGSSKRYPKAWDPQVAPIADQVASLRGLPFEHPVPVRYVPDKAFRTGVGVDSSKLSPAARHRVENLAATLRALGLIDAQTDLVKSFDTVNQAGVLAYYDPTAEEIVIRGVGPLDIERKATLAHELTHVLQDQHFDLQTLRSDAAASANGSSGALTALIEGDAERIKYEYLQSLSKADRDAFDAAEAKTGSSVDGEVAGAAEIVKIETSAPYLFGPEVLRVITANGGNDAVNDALVRSAPTDAIFLNPVAALSDTDVVSVPVPVIERGARPVGEPDTLGAFDLFTVLASRLDRQTALDAADAWAGDRMVTYRSKGSVCVRTTIVGTTKADSSTLARALAAWAATMPSARVASDLASRHSTLTTCDSGAVRAPDATKLEEALLLVSSRNRVLAEMLDADIPLPVSECASRRLVLDPLFISSLERGDAALTPAEQSEARSSTEHLLEECRGPRRAT